MMMIMIDDDDDDDDADENEDWDTSVQNGDKQFPHRWPYCQVIQFGGTSDL